MRSRYSFPTIHWCCVILIATAFLGCRSDSEDDVEFDEEVVDEVEVEDGTGVDDEQKEEVFGLPLPPEYFHLRSGKYTVEVATHMNLDELQEFFEATVVDYEVLRPGKRLRLLPLRSGGATATASRYSGRNTHHVVNYYYTPPLESIGYQPLPEPREKAETDDEDAPEFASRDRVRSSDRHLPSWVQERKGDPVEIRGDDGELVAPGARWGEPYYPPEGSPLDQDRYRHLFGTAYGAW